MLSGRIKFSLYLIRAISYFFYIINVKIHLIFTPPPPSFIISTPIISAASRYRSYYYSGTVY